MFTSMYEYKVYLPLQSVTYQKKLMKKRIKINKSKKNLHNLATYRK